MDLDDEQARVRSRQDLARFVGLMAEDLRTHPDAWENISLYHFLESLAAYIEDREQAAANQGRQLAPEPTWAEFADMLMGGRIYE